MRSDQPKGNPSRHETLVDENWLQSSLKFPDATFLRVGKENQFQASYYRHGNLGSQTAAGFL